MLYLESLGYSLEWELDHGDAPPSHPRYLEAILERNRDRLQPVQRDQVHQNDASSVHLNSREYKGSGAYHVTRNMCVSVMHAGSGAYHVTRNIYMSVYQRCMQDQVLII